jgi:redox-sensitive bicupin YhaK (pirin superfamily)
MLDEFEGSAKEGAGFPDHPHRYITVKVKLKFEFKGSVKEGGGFPDHPHRYCR